MATIEKRGDTYRITVSCGYGLNGKQVKRKTTWKPSPGMTKKQIEKELNRQATLFEDKCNGLLSGGNVKFETLAREWFDHTEKLNLLRPRTIDRMKQLQARTYAAIGHLRMEKLTSAHIQSFIDNLAEPGVNKHTGGGLSAKTQKHYLGFISDVFEYAIKNNMVEFNPCRRVDIKNEPSKEKEIYTPEEAQLFLDKLEEKAPMNFKVFFTLALYGGFRNGELLGFEWKDINFDVGVISVVRTSLYTKDRGMFTDTTKTEKSQRSLKLPTEVVDLLRVYKAEQARERVKLGDRWTDTDRLFTTWTGRRWGIQRR